MTRYVTLTEAMAVVDRNSWHVRDLGLLDSVCQRPRARMYDVELYEGLDLKAATIMDSANRLHPLHDGNKRLSLILVHVFYALNGRRLVGDQIEMADFVIEVADTHLPLEKMSEWLDAHTRERRG
ncbi:type II toxin-antitoxin system death-on-curing family toxin [Oerskovia turbata]|uniref:Type II toxin-antitoxin system death-on-curing family toxin n=1 Tax=Oerskovia turbata TaxID=1713 RepID=A0A4Q1L153_9CELL|nr:type II toxin-antitoxin system death-on-curing family toxin [Oerskovia turbata]RXR28066.1 type II toxin-antitoxin system death-on-curing family toxin [Oerskovia turbata]RXR35925.1 type II toxin-antitoxin system death-on-curing family toxin [Oerskovia turbata]TGJ94837.1 type II toxin-antitoxin system death-on-curing family toxin [Actinotalea fermentans ATCC 43279 = JCM 9966 = DSM 3133]